MKNYWLKFIYWLRKLMTAPLILENCSHSIKPQDIVSAVLIRKKTGLTELSIPTPTSRLPLRVPATPHNINVISLYCSIYEFSEENDEEYVEISESIQNATMRINNRKALKI